LSIWNTFTQELRDIYCLDLDVDVLSATFASSLDKPIMLQLTQTRSMQMQRCAAGLPRLQPRISVNSVRAARRAVCVRATGDDNKDKQQGLETKEGRYSRMVEELAKTGMTPAKAKVGKH
jgi:phage baseplate assembly protein W